MCSPNSALSVSKSSNQLPKRSQRIRLVFGQKWVMIPTILKSGTNIGESITIRAV